MYVFEMNFLQWLRFHTIGPLSSSQLRIAVGYSDSPNFAEPSWPDLHHIISGEGIKKSLAHVSTVQGHKSGTFDKYFAPHVGKDAVAATGMVARSEAFSKGTLRLASKNHVDPPFIDPKFLDLPTELQKMVDGTLNRKLRKFLSKYIYSYPCVETREWTTG